MQCVGFQFFSIYVLYRIFLVHLRKVPNQFLYPDYVFITAVGLQIVCECKGSDYCGNSVIFVLLSVP